MAKACRPGRTQEVRPNNSVENMAVLSSLLEHTKLIPSQNVAGIHGNNSPKIYTHGYSTEIYYVGWYT